MEKNNQNAPKKRHSFLVFLLALIIVGAIIFGIVKFVSCISTSSSPPSSTTNSSNSYNSNSSSGSGSSTPQLFSRSANIGDILIDSDLDLSSLGSKYTITPQTDIKGLVITITYLDNDKNKLTDFVKTLGNVQKGVQVNFSISLLDLGLSIAWNTKYERISVTGGTVSYFA